MSTLDGLEFLPENAATAATPAADTRPQPDLIEQLGAAMRTQVDTVAEVQTERRSAAYKPLIDALLERGLSRDYLMRGGEPVAGADVASAAQDYNYATVFREAKRLGIEGLPASQEDFEREAYRRNGGRDADQALLARGEGAAATVAQFAGGMIGSFRDPVNIVTLPFGGGGRRAATKIITEGLAGATGAAVALPGTAHAYANMGEDFTAGDAALEVGLAAAGGAAVRGGIEAAPKIDAAAYRAAAPVRARFDRFFADRDLARAFAQAVPDHVRTPEQDAALRVLARETELDETSPYVRTIAGDDAHRARLGEAAERLTSAGGAQRGPGNLNPRILSLLRGRGYSEAHARGIAAGIHAESGGNPLAVNPTSGAFGIGQWLGSRKAELFRRYGRNPTLEQQVAFLDWELKGGDHGGARVLGQNDEAGVLRSYIVDFMRPAAGAETTGDLSRGMAALGRAGEALDPGDAGNALDGIDFGEDLPVVRPEALDAERPFVSSAGRQVPIERFATGDIGVDAALMQFKSGGDEFGVIDTLRGIQEWDEPSAGALVVWEGLDGRRLIADGHQRLGLAKRLEAAGHPPIGLNAFVLREVDGYSARDARIVTALMNIGQKTGTVTDAGKVFREAGPEFEDLIRRRVPPSSPLLRDGKALARLSDEAFGAVINEVIPEGHAAAIGHLAPDPETHLALVELLAKTDPANRRQAEAIVKQALEAGFTKEVQDELFGARELTNSLFAIKARLLDRTLLELKRLKGAFGVAARNADALEGAGNTIDVAGSTAAAEANARALGLVEALALRKGNAVNELVDEAARKLAAGEPLARVTRELVAGIRKLDLADLERTGRAADGAGDGALGSGRGGFNPREAGEDQGLTPADRDAIEEVEDLGPSLFGDGEPAAQAFDSDAGEGVKAAAESDWHDIRASQDPNIADRQRQETALKAGSPMRGTAEQDGTGGLALFDQADEPTFDLGDGKGARSAADIETEIAADKAGLEEIRKSLA